MNAMAVLRAWEGFKKGTYVFYNPLTGDRFRDLKASLKTAGKKAGLKKISWHLFRHTHASRLLQAGADLVTVKELMGHSTVIVTMRYAHTSDEVKKKAVKSVGGSDKPVTVIPKPRRTRQ
jgi:site-specific recombinase XerD